MLFFSDFRRHVRHFFGVVLELARPLEACCFPPLGDFFEAVLLQQPQATESVEKCCFSVRGMVFPCPGGDCCFIARSRRQQNLSKNLSKKCCFSRISDDTLGSFLAWFCQRHGVSPPGGDCFEAVLLLAAAGNRICRKKLSTNAVFLGFQTTR